MFNPPSPTDAACRCHAQVAAGSLVLKDVPPKIMVAGSPARPVGKVSGGHLLLTFHGFYRVFHLHSPLTWFPLTLSPNPSLNVS